MEHESGRQIGAASAVMWTLYWTVMVKRELKTKVFQLIYIPNLRVMSFGLVTSSGAPAKEKDVCATLTAAAATRTRLSGGKNPH